MPRGHSREYMRKLRRKYGIGEFAKRRRKTKAKTSKAKRSRRLAVNKGHWLF